MLQWKLVRSAISLVVLVLVAAVLAQAGMEAGVAPAGSMQSDDPGLSEGTSASVDDEIHFGW